MPKQTFFNLPEEKREFILRTAVDEFSDKGYKDASISSIVAAAKIAKGSFYQYFDDKDDLYAHIITTMIAERKLAVFESERHRLADLSLTQFLRLVFHRQMEEFQREPALIRVALDFAKLDGEPVYKKLTAYYKPRLENYFTPFIQHEIGQGEIAPEVNVSMLNFMLISIGQYLTWRYQELGAEAITPEFIDKLCGDLEYILANGIYRPANQAVR